MTHLSPFLRWLYDVQESGVGTWVRTSPWGLFDFLVVHTISMGVLAGVGGAFSLRVLGLARGVPLSRFRETFPLMGFALAVAVLSGVFLVIGYPAKALTNPVFYLKLVVVTAALALTVVLARALTRDAAADGVRPPPWTRRVAAGALICWALGITGGRFLAYTHHILMVGQ